MPHALDDPRLEPRPIAPLPAAAADLPPAAAIVETEPAPGRYPEITVAGERFAVRARAVAPPGTPEMRGVVRWRAALSPRWTEEPLQNVGDNHFEGGWTPPRAGEYEWTVELWTGDDDLLREGSSGADALHLLRAERADLAPATWHHAARAHLSQLAGEATSAAERGCEAFLLPVIFAQDPESGAVGKGELGHYSLDPELGDTHDFGRLAAAADTLGLTLALTLPLECSASHPFRARDPHAFGADGVPDLLGGDWRGRWEQWEAVFRFWIVQGIDVFHIPHPERTPVAFWQHLIESLRDDFPELAFSWTPAEAPELREHLAAAGFSSFEIPAAAAAATQAEGTPAAETAGSEGVVCFSTNPAIHATLSTNEGGGHRLHVTSDTPDSPQRGHIHLDAERLDLEEGDSYHLYDLADGRALRWSGTTNFIVLEPGMAARTFRIERA